MSIVIIAASLWRVAHPEPDTGLVERWFPVIGLLMFLAALAVYRWRGAEDAPESR